MKRYEYERLNHDLLGERLRAARHHEVLCLMLKEHDWNNEEESDADRVERSRAIADLAYPPPKDEP